MSRKLPCVLPPRCHLPTHSGAAQLSVMSFNVLKPDFATQEITPWCAQPFLEWEHRRPLIHREVQRRSPDVLCLQEMCTESFDEDFRQPLCSEGYACVLQNSKKRANGHTMANAVFWKKSHFSEEAEWVNHRSRAVLVALRLRTGDKRLVYVANVHLQGSPDAVEDRFNQMRSLLKHLRAHQLRHHDGVAQASTVLCGDFNCGPHSSIHEMLTSGKLAKDYREDAFPDISVNKSEFQHEFRLRSAYEGRYGALGPTFSHERFKGVIDFIFVSTPTLRVDGVSQIYDNEEHKERVLREYLPSQDHPSDHLPVCCVLTLL